MDDLFNLARLQEYDLPIDDTLQLLSDPYVRYVLDYLSNESAPVSLTELADVVTGYDTIDDDAIATRTERDVTRLKLYHTTLPKLDKVGYLEFDWEENVIREIDIPSGIYGVFAVSD